MDHDETRETLELAAVEPDGLERLLAGDTPTAQAVAAHLAGCVSCTDEFVRLQRASAIIGTVVREMPPPELRDRTLATIRAEGVVRPLPTIIGGPVPVSVASWQRPGTRWRMVGWIGTIAAAVLLSVTTTTLVVGARVDDQLAAQARTITGLERVTYATMSVTAEPDAAQISLAGVKDPKVAGNLVFSPSTTQLVIVADGLEPPAAGLEYRCWVEVDGTRKRVGKMFFGDDLAYWAGTSPAVEGVSADATFGVSLVIAAGSSLAGPPVLLGGL
jgi:hypothetical protein